MGWEGNDILSTCVFAHTKGVEVEEKHEKRCLGGEGGVDDTDLNWCPYLGVQ